MTQLSFEENECLKNMKSHAGHAGKPTLLDSAHANAFATPTKIAPLTTQRLSG